MIKRLLGFLKRRWGRLLLGSFLLMVLGLTGSLVHFMGWLRPLRYDLCVPLVDLAPGQYGPSETYLSEDGNLLWVVYVTRNQETRILRCDRRTRSVVRDDRALAAIKAEAGLDFLDPAHLLAYPSNRVVASVTGLPFFTLVYTPNYLSPDPATISLFRTINGRIRWNLALKGGDVPIATQFVWGMSPEAERNLTSPAIAANDDGSVISMWDARSGKLFLIFNEKDYRE